ncbi:uncharacterized protein [Miscanthus floridulus]|uniref:uncharacterized protein isoform X2 n=2 Tax=Miscanthus floridulus TaxID=154761 RepID=UPI00345A080F
MLAEGQRTMAEALRTIANRDGRGPRQGPDPNQYSDFKDFLDTKPPIFKEAEEPLQADEWLNTLEQKFRLLRLTEVLKTEYASHQLHGPAGIWWSHHRSTMPANAQITWDQFKSAFRGNYIPPGLMAIKHTEFMKLTQGNKSLNEYLQAFNNLARYATEFVDTDAKKIASFKRGLSPKLMKTMGNCKCAHFNEFVSDALSQENNNAVYAASKSRKRAYEAGASQSKAPVAQRAPFRPPASAAKFRPPQKRNPVKTGFRKAFTVALPKGTTSQGSSRAPPSNMPCWNCNKTGHWARECPYPKKNNYQGGHQGQVNHTNITEIPSGVPEGVTLLEFEGANQEEEPEVQETDEAVAAEELPECPDHQPSSFLKDDLLYQGFCKYCLHPAGDED